VASTPAGPKRLIRGRTRSATGPHRRLHPHRHRGRRPVEALHDRDRLVIQPGLVGPFAHGPGPSSARTPLAASSRPETVIGRCGSLGPTTSATSATPPSARRSTSAPAPSPAASTATRSRP
jgi:hypothetical protein